jgi:hypothetical protein
MNFDDYFLDEYAYTPGSQSRAAAVESERCVICTLPYGTCTHTKRLTGGIMTQTQQRKLLAAQDAANNAPLTETEQDIDDILGVLGDGVKVEIKPEFVDTLDINALSWRVADIRLSDKIDTTSVAYSLPKERGWHSLTNVGNQFLVLFGGISYRFVSCNGFVQHR